MDKLTINAQCAKKVMSGGQGKTINIQSSKVSLVIYLYKISLLFERKDSNNNNNLKRRGEAMARKAVSATICSD